MKKLEEENNEPPKINQYKKIYLELVSKYFGLALIVMVLLVFAIGYVFILKPKYDKVSSVITKRNEFKLSNQAILENNLSVINRYKSTYNQIDKEKLAKIDAILPPFNSNEEFFTTFEQMILKRGYYIKSLTVASDVTVEEKSQKKIEKEQVALSQNPQIGTITIEMSLEGVDYKGLKKLLALVEANLRIMDVTKLSYSYEAETLNMTIDTYYLK